MALKAGEIEKVKLTAKDMGMAQAPLIKGDDAGKLEVYLDGKLMRSIKLEYTESIESSSPFFYLKRILREYFTEVY